MTCKHPVIQTWRHEDGEPAMWSCVDCRHKFVPFSQMLQEVADEREACAQVAEDMLRFYTQAVTGVPQAIRARTKGEKNT